MSDLLEDVNLLKYFLTAMLVLQLLKLDYLYCDKLTSKLMNSEINLSKGAFTNLINKFIEVQAGRWELLILPHILFDVANDLISIFIAFLV